MHKILKLGWFRGTQHQLEYTPHPPNKESIHPGPLIRKGIRIKEGSTEVHRCFWGSWGSEVPRLSLPQHLPVELNPLLDSLTPLVTYP